MLLAFGVLPLSVAISVGYIASRKLVQVQGREALEAVTAGQAGHLAMELDRQRLLLRTIAGQLPPPDRLVALASGELAQRLVQGLPEGGVFDGLRVVADDGRVLGMVALRNRQPHWPPSAPAADWSSREVAVHSDASGVLAYLVAVPLGRDGGGPWLEGHVRQKDFQQVFSLPDHLFAGTEFAIVDTAGRLILSGHAHAGNELPALGQHRLAEGLPVAEIRDPSGGRLLVVARVGRTDWRLLAALPLEFLLAPLARLRNLAVAGTVILVLLVVVIGVYSARSVTTPLRRLAEAASRFGHQGSYHALSIPARDETGILVTAFNEMAANLERSRTELDALHARELERAQQLATVGELASGVAHEIRNPLTGVAGALDLALRQISTDEPARALLEEAQRQLRRIDGATTQLLRYARPPALRQVTVDASLLVERAVTLVAPQASRAGVTLQVDRASGPVPVRADPELLVQVLVNLTLNAMEVLAPGQHVSVWVARHAPDVWIGVRDTGPGVPPDLRGDIFRPFFTTKHQGTGLGLSISQQIVTRHGGTLRMEDTPGGGATFVVSLPLALQGEEDGHAAG